MVTFNCLDSPLSLTVSPAYLSTHSAFSSFLNQLILVKPFLLFFLAWATLDLLSLYRESEKVHCYTVCWSHFQIVDSVCFYSTSRHIFKWSVLKFKAVSSSVNLKGIQKEKSKQKQTSKYSTFPVFPDILDIRVYIHCNFPD